MGERISLGLIFMNSIGGLLLEVFLIKYVSLFFMGLWILGCKSPETIKGRIIFRGFCRIKEPDSTDNSNDINTVAFHAREAVF